MLRAVSCELHDASKANLKQYRPNRGYMAIRSVATSHPANWGNMRLEKNSSTGSSASTTRSKPLPLARRPNRVEIRQFNSVRLLQHSLVSRFHHRPGEH